ncbi:hypothetical protein CY0110_15552 [Crocosphaera chwakensis CCY0110]|uniref:Uncharacterized protein n=1 Tax=Crocosphaera chwakensis CCY0110 TaxID=391612 RepID=A3IHE2_9CHRO|nr:hypothetical protein CY0110_15552 [Crocosphaera chwakensis CCY0110]
MSPRVNLTLSKLTDSIPTDHTKHIIV